VRPLLVYTFCILWIEMPFMRHHLPFRTLAVYEMFAEPHGVWDRLCTSSTRTTCDCKVIYGVIDGMKKV